MPRKVRELRADLRREGFALLPKRGKGSHTYYRDAVSGATVNLSGQDGNDADVYQEKAVAEAIRTAQEARKP